MVGASYSPLTDEIKGCEPGSLMWWHEAGHRRTRYLCLFSNASLFLAFITFIIMGVVFLLTGEESIIILDVLQLMIWLSFRFFLEVFAWLYAFWNCKRGLKSLLNDRFWCEGGGFEW